MISSDLGRYRLVVLGFTLVELAEHAERPTDAMSSAGSSHDIKRLLLLVAQSAHQERARAFQRATLDRR
jgi:hypothetical protein